MKDLVVVTEAEFDAFLEAYVPKSGVLRVSRPAVHPAVELYHDGVELVARVVLGSEHGGTDKFSVAR